MYRRFQRTDACALSFCTSSMLMFAEVDSRFDIISIYCLNILTANIRFEYPVFEYPNNWNKYRDNRQNFWQRVKMRYWNFLKFSCIFFWGIKLVYIGHVTWRTSLKNNLNKCCGYLKTFWSKIITSERSKRNSY